ncbi:3-keto-5-aminohexanoate cleavage protein [Nitrospirillum sp. BR 11828]|uniref:3-keto-5-aminohexanoate cleavage protein n=1 Tax=Nitrospirillum sp. BR 11828 TaxID=3104325 RepID=UPI002ACA6C56|nr:3-keto-5-aminohexanoate cleavage protein [Nitrospirillum sp. BR 11828]MDZ5650260.1 3-keto-5-aminohexanoate cleavage protein [Nitrospirillum sp. BR 11828]
MNADPVILTVAPNGARRLKTDHPAIPLDPAEIAQDAAACLEAGAAMVHMHVRDAQGRHLLDADAYAAATRAVRDAVGDRLVIQVTTEAAGLYHPPHQMAVIRALKPEAVSLAIRELAPDSAHEKDAADFFAWLARERIMVQTILYSRDDLLRWHDLRRRGVVPEVPHFLLYVLGRYTAGQVSDPRDLLPFLEPVADAPNDNTGDVPWAVCAFGRRENACVLTATGLGGHVRVGFENNLHLPDGTLAPDNAALVAAAAQGGRLMGRPPATADDVRARFG